MVPVVPVLLYTGHRGSVAKRRAVFQNVWNTFMYFVLFKKNVPGNNEQGSASTSWGRQAKGAVIEACSYGVCSALLVQGFSSPSC